MPCIIDVHLSTEGHGTTMVFPGQNPAGPAHQELMNRLIVAIGNSPAKKKVKREDGSRWRTPRMREGRYTLRRMRDVCPNIDQLGLPQWIKALLLGSKMRDAGA
jgi:twitching motility protein PilT